MPETEFRLLRGAAAHQQIQLRVMLLQQIGGHMRANVTGPTGQEYRHVAPFVPVLIASPISLVDGAAEDAPVEGGICKMRGARASRERPSIRGYVHRRSAGI